MSIPLPSKNSNAVSRLRKPNLQNCAARADNLAMKTLTLALITLTLLATAPARAVTAPTFTLTYVSAGHFPDPPLCPTCFTASAIDAVDSNQTIWGWTGYCYDGAYPTAVTATAVVNGQPTTVQVEENFGGPRSDVTTHLINSGCHGGNTVFAFWFPDGLPTGTTSVSVKIHREATFAYHVFDVQ